MRYTLLATLVWMAAATAAAPQTHPPAASRLTIHKNVGEVVIDLVVTDAHGKLVRQLRPAELQVLDNLHPQKILSFRRVSASVHLTGELIRQAGLPSRFRAQPFNLVALVFDRLGTAGQVLARQAARQLIANLGPRDYVAVFGVGHALALLQDFTLNKTLALRAINAATSGASRSYQEMAEAGRILMMQTIAQTEVKEGKQPIAYQQAVFQSLTNGDAGTAPGFNPLEQLSPTQIILTHILARDLMASAAAVAEDRSWASLGALEHLVHALQPLPGRKSVAYFSQLLRVDNNTNALFQRLVRDSNRAGVSFYPVDTRGLSVHSSAAQQRDSLNFAVAVSQDNSLANARERTTSEQAHEFDAVADVQYAGRLTNLAALAAATGGFLSARSNNLDPYMRRLAGDLGHQYELSYSPASGMDGAYHSITIRIPGHPDWRVRARKGYFAIPRMASPIETYALPALALLQRPQPAHDFAFGLAGYEFPEDPREPTLDLVAAVPLAGLRPYPAPAASVAKNPKLQGRDLLHVVVLQLVRDRQGRIVRNFSRQYEWSAPPAALARFQHKTMIFRRLLRLPAGAYTLATAIYEPHGHAASVRQRALQVAAALPGGLRLSSIVPVSAASPLAAAPAHFDPLYPRIQGQWLRIDPSSGNVLPEIKGKPLGFYFIAYLPPGAPPARAELAFYRAGMPFAGLRLALPPPDARGRVPFLARVDDSSLPPGSYRLRITVHSGARSAARSLKFRIVRPMPAH